MVGWNRPAEVSEKEATGEVARIYQEIRQTLRVTGVNLNFRMWATFPRFFAALWEAMRPNVETRVFEEAADRLRVQAVQIAAGLGKLDAVPSVRLDSTQAERVRGALDLYHYVNPKLLVFSSAVRLALAGEPTGNQGAANGDLIELGTPPSMRPLEMVAPEPEDPRLRELFTDIKQTLSLVTINSDYRTLALWPDYLSAVWERLKPRTLWPQYSQAADTLSAMALLLARSLPYPIPLSKDRIKEMGEDADRVFELTNRFEHLEPRLIINIALMQLDWQPPERLVNSPYPVTAQRDSLSRARRETE